MKGYSYVDFLKESFVVLIIGHRVGARGIGFQQISGDRWGWREGGTTI